MIYFLPIEPLEARYTAQMLKWVSGDLEGLVGKDGFIVVLPEHSDKIKHGQFLDSYESNRFKAAQLQKVAEYFSVGEVRTGDLFLLGDVWFPGIEAVRMMADLAGVHVRIAGWHYAGTFDTADFYHRGLGPWARRFEEMLCEQLLDAVCVGSSSHAALLARNMRMPTICAYGLSWKPKTLPAHSNQQRANIVVFPHRIAPEKNLPAFLRCARKLRQKHWRFVISVPKSLEGAALPTVDADIIVHPDKQSYYDLLHHSKIVYSAAHQETFGYAINEAIACGCSVVAPNRLSYPEVLERDNKFLYSEDDPDGEALLECRMNKFEPVPFRYTDKYSDSTIRFLKRILQP
jgi:glycosyltransferase involved in cell wall biosynthesis